MWTIHVLEKYLHLLILRLVDDESFLQEFAVVVVCDFYVIYVSRYLDQSVELPEQCQASLWKYLIKNHAQYCYPLNKSKQENFHAQLRIRVRVALSPLFLVYGAGPRARQQISAQNSFKIMVTVKYFF